MTAKATGHSAEVGPARFKDVLGRFPTGVSVLTAAHRGRHHAMTASSLVSVSLEPPLVLFCVDHNARFHDVVVEAGRWAANVLSEDQCAVSDRFAGRADRNGRDFAGVPHGHGQHTGAALLDDAVAVIECRTWATYDGGDHTIVVGLVLAADVRRPAARPLTYWRGRYRTLNPSDSAPRPNNPDVA